MELLLSKLVSTIELLRAHGEMHWSAWLSEDLERLRIGDASALNHLLSAFGGMGSLSDLILCPQNGHRIDESRVEDVNAELSRLRSEIFETARRLSRSGP